MTKKVIAIPKGNCFDIDVCKLAASRHIIA